MNPHFIIQKYYQPNTKAYRLLIGHGWAVAVKAVEIAKRVSELNPDVQFIKQAALLHDIGMFLTDEPDLGCFGNEPYICHGFLGSQILKTEGYPQHALVCERHVGTGLSQQEIEKHNLPLPKRDMLPISIEEQIICYADKFFSKNEARLTKEKSLAEIKASLVPFGQHRVAQFEQWREMFGD